MAISLKKISESHVLKTLTLIHRFGWLGTLELGQWLWPKSKNPRVNVSNLVNKILVDLVIVREMPENVGNALVLSEQGAKKLKKLTGNQYKNVRSGKDIGNMVDGKWYPPVKWKHDLIAQSYIIKFLNYQVYDFLTERELRQADIEEPGYLSKSIRYPDFICWRRDKPARAVAVEVEVSPKGGKKRDLMCHSIKWSNERSYHTFNGHLPIESLLIYDKNQKNTRGYLVDHKKNVIHGLQKIVLQDKPIKVGFMPVTLVNYRITSIVEVIKKTVTFNPNVRLLANMHQFALEQMMKNGALEKNGDWAEKEFTHDNQRYVATLGKNDGEDFHILCIFKMYSNGEHGYYEEWVYGDDVPHETGDLKREPLFTEELKRPIDVVNVIRDFVRPPFVEDEME